MRLPTLPMADWTASAPTRRSALASCVTVASGYDSTAGYFTSLFKRLSANSVAVYLYAILPFFSFLASTQPGAEQAWNGDSGVVRRWVGEYLEEQLGCILRRHRLGFELVQVTGRTRNNVGAFLAALKLFYVVMREVGCYTGENPLVDVTSRMIGEPSDDGCDGDRDDRPKMP